MEKDVVISGVGRSATGRRLGRPSLDLTLDACLAAMADAGLEPADIDGLVSWPGEGVVAGAGFTGPGIMQVQDAMRLSLNWFAAGLDGLNLLGHVLDGCMAVSSGLARHVLCYRTITEATAQAKSRRPPIGGRSRVSGQMAWVLPFGAASAAHWAAWSAQLHFDQYGTTPEQLGQVAVRQRANAARNPDAIYTEPITIDDYLASRLIAWPLHLYDCDAPADGSFAFVLSPKAYAKDAPNGAVAFEAVAATRNGRALWEQRDDMLTMMAHDAAARLWARTDLTPDDVDVAQLYDGFSIFVLMWLEAAGFCKPGESGALVASTDLDLDGRLPVNTSGGQLSGGRYVASSLLYEACLQLRGAADGRQVLGAEVALVGSGGGNVGQALLLTTSS
jgi:acetyl-CoA acetyltransferase